MRQGEAQADHGLCTGMAVLALSLSGTGNYSICWELQYDCGCQDHIHHS